MNEPMTNADDRGPVVLAAGGTGGHVMPARALAEALARRGIASAMITDRRGARFFGPELEDAPALVLEAGRLTADLKARAFALARIVPNLAASWRFLRGQRARMLIGFGGYPTLPAAFAAQLAGLPLVVHEQNAVLGRVNRLLAPRARLVALSFPDTRRLPRRLRRVAVTGLPLRRQLRDATPRPVARGNERRILVLGGSQGARILADVVPAAIAALAPVWRGRLSVVQQARPEDVARTRAAYAAAGIRAEVAAFFPDAPQRMAGADLVIARAGAGTLFELAALGRPALVIPLAVATDDHQSVNARHFALRGGLRVLPEAEADPPHLATCLATLLADGEELRRMGAAMAAAATGDGAERLAELVGDLLAEPRSERGRAHGGLELVGGAS